MVFDYYEKVMLNIFSGLIGGVAAGYFMSDKQDYSMMILVVLLSALGIVLLKRKIK